MESWYTRTREPDFILSTRLSKVESMYLEVVNRSDGSECDCETCKGSRSISKKYHRSSTSKQIWEF